MFDLEKIDEQYRNMLKEQKYSDDIGSLNGALVFLSALLIVTMLLLFIMEGYSPKMLISVGILMLMLLLYRFKIKAASEYLESETQKLQGIHGTKAKEISKKLDYLNAAIDLKLTRVRLIKWFYIINFPIFLIALKQLLQDDITDRALLWPLIGALLMSAIVWSLFFRSDKEDLEMEKRKITALSKEVKDAEQARQEEL